MKSKNITITFLLFLSFLATLVGYSVIDPINSFAKPPFKVKQKFKNKGHGPPPHAPAHGYRFKHHHGVELKFDSGLGVYAVLEMRGVYFHNGLYIKVFEGKWFVSNFFNKSWRVAIKGEIPYKLKKVKGIKVKKKFKAKGKGKKKFK